MKKILLVLILATFALTAHSERKNAGSQVKAVVFYKPDCCQETFGEIFPRLKKRYGRHLKILGVDTSTSEGAKLYLNFLLKFGVPLSQELPLLVSGDSSFRSPSLIKENFPSFIEERLKRGGMDWPDSPRLQKILREMKDDRQDPPAVWISDGSFRGEASFREKALKNFSRDPLGYAFAATIELLMIFSLTAALMRFFFGNPPDIGRIFPPRLFPVFSIIGLLIALYLSVAKATGSEAVCGPIGDCRSVQNSSYSYILGIIPVAVLGAGCFMFVLALWFSRRFGSLNYKKLSLLTIRTILMAGVTFFIYLTYLEIFIIGAVCSWCLASAAVMTLMLWTSIANE